MVVVALRRLIPFACAINGSTAWSCDLVLALGATAAVIQTDDILLCHTQGINDHHHRPPAHKQQQVGWLAAISNVQRIINIVIMGERERAIQNLSTHYTEWESSTSTWNRSIGHFTTWSIPPCTHSALSIYTYVLAWPAELMGQMSFHKVYKTVIVVMREFYYLLDNDNINILILRKGISSQADSWQKGELWTFVIVAKVNWLNHYYY